MIQVTLFFIPLPADERELLRCLVPGEMSELSVSLGLFDCWSQALDAAADATADVYVSSRLQCVSIAPVATRGGRWVEPSLL